MQGDGPLPEWKIGRKFDGEYYNVLKPGIKREWRGRKQPVCALTLDFGRQIISTKWKGEETMVYRIGFAGTDGRTLLSAIETSKAVSEIYHEEMMGVVMRGTPSMPKFTELMGWPVEFIPTKDNSVEAYGEAMVEALTNGTVDCIVPMPESLLFEGLIDRITAAGGDLADRVAGLTAEGSFIEADKVRCKEFCKERGIPVADEWSSVDARDY